MYVSERFDIYVPQEVKHILESDAILFEFYKNDKSTINMNRFLTAIIQGYHNSYISEQIESLNHIVSEIQDIVLDKEKCTAVATRICNQILFPASLKNKSNKKERISLKPTKAIQQIIKSIPETELPDASVSKYFCKLFISYANKPISLRERIVFSEKLAILEDACKNGWNLELTTTSSDDIHHIIPYRISTGKEELFNYLLCAEVKKGKKPKATTYRLNRIDWISKSAEKATITDEIQQNLIRMINNSPLYSINNDPLIRIKLTNKGRDLYRKIYYGRPEGCSISEEKDGACIISFDCSIPQAFFYFRKFDQDTIEIIEPQELINKMKSFYAKAIEPLGLSFSTISED